jgi:hypothetical protein
MVGLVCSRVVASEEKAGTASRKALPSRVQLACRFKLKQKGQKHLFTRGLKGEQIVSRSDRGLDMVFRITWYGASGATSEMHLAEW